MAVFHKFYLVQLWIPWPRYLTRSWRRPLSYRNQSIDLHSRSMDWFPFDNGVHHERVKRALNTSLLMVEPLINIIFIDRSICLPIRMSRSKHDVILKGYWELLYNNYLILDGNCNIWRTWWWWNIPNDLIWICLLWYNRFLSHSFGC